MMRIISALLLIAVLCTLGCGEPSGSSGSAGNKSTSSSKSAKAAASSPTVQDKAGTQEKPKSTEARLSLTAPKDVVTVEKGKSTVVTVKIDASHIDGDITLKTDAPAGLRAREVTVKGDASEAKIELLADSTAKVTENGRESEVKVTAIARHVDWATVTFKVAIKYGR